MGTDLFFDFSLQYEPFGPLKGLTYGNGINETRSYDLAGRLSGITTPGKQSQTFGYDPADNLTSITDTLRAVQGGTFGYDALSRLTTQTSTASNRLFSYDSTGNRTQLQQTSAPTSTVPFTIVTSATSSARAVRDSRSPRAFTRAPDHCAASAT